MKGFMPCLSFNRKNGKERGFALGLLVGLADMSLYSLGPMNLTVLPEPEGRAALSSSYQILLKPSTRTADAAADGSLISFLLALDLGWHCLAKQEIEWLGLVFPG